MVSAIARNAPNRNRNRNRNANAANNRACAMRERNRA